MKLIHQNVGEELLKAVGGLDQALDDEVVAITVDYESGQEIAFGINAAAEDRVDAELLAEMKRLIEAVSKKTLIDPGVAACEESKSDLGFRAIESFADDISAFVVNGNNRPGVRIALSDIASINPKVTAPDPFDAALADLDLSMFHRV